MGDYGFTSQQRKLKRQIIETKLALNRVKGDEKKDTHEMTLFNLEMQWENISPLNKKTNRRVRKRSLWISKPIKSDRLVSCSLCGRNLKHHIDVKGAYIWLKLNNPKYIGKKRCYLEEDIKKAFVV
jgi:hypothetical protein